MIPVNPTTFGAQPFAKRRSFYLTPSLAILGRTLLGLVITPLLCLITQIDVHAQTTSKSNPSQTRSQKAKIKQSPLVKKKNTSRSLSYTQQLQQTKKQGYVNEQEYPIQDHFSTYFSAFLPLGGGYWIYNKPYSSWALTTLQLVGLSLWGIGKVQRKMNDHAAWQYVEHMGMFSTLSSWLAGILMWKTDPFILVQPNASQKRPLQLSLGYQWFFQNRLDLFRGKLGYFGSWIHFQMDFAYQQAVNGFGVDFKSKLPIHSLTNTALLDLYIGFLGRQWFWSAYRDELQTSQFIARPYLDWRIQFKSFAPSLKNTYFYQQVGYNSEAFSSTNPNETLIEVYTKRTSFQRTFMSYKSGMHFDFSNLFKVDLGYIQDLANIITPFDLWSLKVIFTEEDWSFDCQLYWGNGSAVQCMYHMGFGGTP